jgi:hypothetical protein
MAKKATKDEKAAKQRKDDRDAKIKADQAKEKAARAAKPKNKRFENVSKAGHGNEVGGLAPRWMIGKGVSAV